jgi:hypothetical protein
MAAVPNHQVRNEYVLLVFLEIQADLQAHNGNENYAAYDRFSFQT